MSDKRLCINLENTCLGRRNKIVCNGTTVCCLDEIKEEREIALSVVDAIEAAIASCPDPISMIRISNRLSYASEVINKEISTTLAETLTLFKRTGILMFEHREKIISDPTLGELVCSFVQVIKEWFNRTFISSEQSYGIYNELDSLKSDLSSIEMALGVCMLPLEESFDDIFF